MQNRGHSNQRVSVLFARTGQLNLRPLMFAFLLLAFSWVSQAQQKPDSGTQPGAGNNWARVKALPAHTKVHVTTDHGGKSCRIFAVSDETFTCAKGSNAPGIELQRKEIKHIKLTHYVRSTLVGAGAAGAVGAIAGGIAGRTKPCPPGGGLCLNGIGLGAGAVALVFGVGSAVLGGVVGGATDLARGSSIYTRP